MLDCSVDLSVDEAGVIVDGDPNAIRFGTAIDSCQIEIDSVLDDVITSTGFPWACLAACGLQYSTDMAN